MCGSARRLEARPGPVDPVARLSETTVAFARWYLCGFETAIAFAGEKWVFWVSVSVAVVMVVSCWSASAVAVVMAVSQLPRGCVLCVKKFALLGLLPA